MNGILFAAPTAWDEACFAVPTVRALIASGLAVTLLCPNEQEAFWSTIPGLQILHFDSRTRAKAIAAALPQGLEAALLWEEGPAAQASVLARIPRRSGPSGSKNLNKCLTDPLPPTAPGPVEHRVRHYLALAEALGIETRIPAYFEPAPLGIAPVPGTLLISPESDWGRSHEWPLDRWTTVCQHLIGQGYRLTLASIAEGKGLATKLLQSLGEEVRHVVLQPLGASLPILAAHERILTADSSLPHLAAHAGATCIVLFGPNDPEWKRPLGRRHTVVRRHVECAPCFAPKCAMDLRCQNDLSVERVLSALR